MGKTPQAPGEDTLNYLLRDIPTELWRRVKSKAALGGQSLRDVLLQLLRDYVKR